MRMGMRREGKRRQGEREDVSHSEENKLPWVRCESFFCVTSSSPLGLAVLLSILSATMAGACLCTSQRPIGLGPLLLVLLTSALCAGSCIAPPLPTSSISLASLSGREVGHIVWLFRPWMGMGIVALAVYTHNEQWQVQGSVLSFTCVPLTTQTPH